MSIYSLSFFSQYLYYQWIMTCILVCRLHKATVWFQKTWNRFKILLQWFYVIFEAVNGTLHHSEFLHNSIPQKKRKSRLYKSWSFIVGWTNSAKVSHQSVNHCFLFIPVRIAAQASLRESRCPVESKRRTEGRPSCLSENHIVCISGNSRFGQAKHGADEAISAIAVEGRPALLFI